jgi:hypothetical protein
MRFVIDRALTARCASCAHANQCDREERFSYSASQWCRAWTSGHDIEESDEGDFDD